MTKNNFYLHYRKLWRTLSAQEQMAAIYVWMGFSDKEISTYLGISVRTVRFHIGHALDKCGSQTRVQLAIVVERSHGQQTLSFPTAIPAWTGVSLFWSK